jgi:hypothetical protein
MLSVIHINQLRTRLVHNLFCFHHYAYYTHRLDWPIKTIAKTWADESHHSTWRRFCIESKGTMIYACTALFKGHYIAGRLLADTCFLHAFAWMARRRSGMGLSDTFFQYWARDGYHFCGGGP